MPTEGALHGQPPVAVFLFGHQDDEFGVYSQIGRELSLGRRVVCSYLTSGVPLGGNPAQRNQESMAVLGQLGVSSCDVVFAGEILSIPDGHLIEHLHGASAWMGPWLKSLGDIAAIYVPAWEGGHPDHDALHAITVQLCLEAGIVERVLQFPLYNAFRCPGQFFRVLSPLKGNGPVRRASVPWLQRMAHLRYALGYPSQKTSWIGLFPFFLLHQFFSGAQAVQPVSVRRIRERPHSGALYYESRRFSSWPEVSGRLAEWLSGR